MNYDNDFIFTASLPFIYFILLSWLFAKKTRNLGPCCIILIIFYAFRTCLLPVLSAYGNFFLEINKDQYIEYYNCGIWAIWLETALVFWSLLYYNKKTQYYQYRSSFSNGTIKRVVMPLSIITMLLVVFVDNNYFHFITSEMLDDISTESNHSGAWYILDLFCTFCRPIVSFMIIAYALKKNNILGSILIVLILGFNILFLTDRRIYSLLISAVILYYLSTKVSSKFLVYISTFILVIGIISFVYLCLYFQIGEGDYMISRTFQHYFSGPSLNGIAFAANANYDYDITMSLKLLFNNFQSLTAVFKKYSIEDSYMLIFGYSKSIWVPMFAGAIRYYGIFAPLLIIFLVRFIVHCDRNIEIESNEIYKMIYLFLGATLSCYMIMYTLELVLYYMLSIVVFYKLLIKFDRNKSLI